jgi:MoaA/NifB/PqqE/SkfB family radical SAM enzyme
MKNYIHFENLDPEHPFYSKKKENYKAIEQQYEGGLHELTTYPARITLQTTEKCNLNCIMCDARRKHNDLLQMDLNTFNKISSELFPYLIELHPTNIGEPLCSPWFELLCKTMAHYGVMLDLTTNGPF